MPDIPAPFLYGLQQQEQQRLLPEVQAAFRRLQTQAKKTGLEVEIVSGYRNFHRQLLIWNRKATGKQAVFDADGKWLDVDRLSDKDKVWAILRWSALPGASRHHWGTDCDVYDTAAVAEGYQVQLTEQESRQQFAQLHHWLDKQIAEGRAEGFYRPYRRKQGGQDTGGIAPEPWHLSYAPIAKQYEQSYSVEELRVILSEADIALKETVLENLADIYQQFIHPSV